MLRSLKNSLSASDEFVFLQEGTETTNHMYQQHHKQTLMNTNLYSECYTTKSKLHIIKAGIYTDPFSAGFQLKSEFLSS